MTDELQSEAEARRDTARLRRREGTGNEGKPLRPVRIYRLSDNDLEYVCTDELADGDPLAALLRRFGRGANIQIIENRPLEGDVWSVETSGDDSGRYLTRRTLIDRE